MLRKFSSPIVANEGTPTTANKNYVKLITKRVSKVTTQLEAATGISRRSLGNSTTKVKCSYGVPISNPVARKSFTFKRQNNNKTLRNLFW